MNFGIPYMGSKGKIAEHIIAMLPKADNFYDLFGGGFSITHCALLSKKWDNYHFNEINSDLCTLIKDAIAGKYSYKVFKPKFISHEEFKELKEKDPYIRVCWSFGNNQKHYLFSKEIEPYKRSMHNAIIFDEFDDTAKKVFGFDHWNGESIKDRRLILRNVVRKDIGERRDLQQLEQLERLQQLQQLERLQQLEQLERLQQLQQLERLQQLSITSQDYMEVEIKPNSIVYCDPPYKGTASYLGSFNNNEFYKWVATNKTPTYFSEYTSDKVSGLYLINAKSKRSLLTSNSRENKTEKIFANKAGLDLFNSTKL